MAAALTSKPAGVVATAERMVKEQREHDISILPPSHLPERLLSLGDAAPRWLFIQGDASVFSIRPAVAVVGTRTPSNLGLSAAQAVANMLGTYPVLLVSGLADGIDSVAHAVSLQHGVKNLAFLGHGIDLVFPESTSDVREQIIRRGGAVASEYLPWQRYQKRQFVERNRLQAAMADLVIPIEAAAASGTAHTIRFARSYARLLVGVTWPSANGIVDGLRDHNDRLIEIFTQAGKRELDSLVKGLLEKAHADPYPFRNLERLALREFGNRCYSQQDLDRLHEALGRELRLKHLQEAPANGPA